MGPALVEVAVSLPLAGTFTYAVPAHLEDVAVPGVRVLVPFGARSVEGVVCGPAAADLALVVQELREVLDTAPVIDGRMLRLLRWIADYYQAPPGEVMRLGLPPGAHVEEARQLRLTEAGVQAVAAQQAALVPPGLDLTSRELAVCAALTPGPAVMKRLRRELGECGAVVARLVQRGLCLSQAERRGGLKLRRETFVRLVREPTPAELTDLLRAPRRSALLARVRSVAEPLSMAALRTDVRARAHVAALVRTGLVETFTREVPQDGLPDAPVEAAPMPTPTAAQAAALRELTAAAGAGYAGFLLHGVTGSGKTEVYLRLIAHVRARGQQAIVLVPEISLTPQLCARFQARFGDDVAVLHSGLTDRERLVGWERLQRGEVGIALGARSAIFAPVRDLGVVVVDEEHDSSFKQDEGVRYNGRDVALVRAQAAGAVAVLGSATPALESYANAQRGRLRLLSLPERATARPLPTVEIVDLRRYRPERAGLFSAPLTVAVQETLAAGDQVILFLNRRGFATSVMCTGCGYAFRCRDCSVMLTAHRGSQRLICHYCGYSVAAATRCPDCRGETLRELGSGTERIEEVVRAQFPGARVARLDRDTAQGRGLRRILDGLRRRDLDIVIGTQMITKGHDFPGVTLVGVLLADMGLALPDFRAGERIFQLLTQVAGRAGRGDRPGRVLIQTYSPDHPSVQCARDHDYVRFFTAESASRQELGYPPHGQMVAIRFDAEEETLVRRAAAELGVRSRVLVAAAPGVSALGPVEAPLPRLRKRFRWHLLLRGPERGVVHGMARALARVDLPRGVRLAVDVDPVSIL